MGQIWHFSAVEAGKERTRSQSWSIGSVFRQCNRLVPFHYHGWYRQKVVAYYRCHLREVVPDSALHDWKSKVQYLLMIVLAGKFRQLLLHPHPFRGPRRLSLLDFGSRMEVSNETLCTEEKVGTVPVVPSWDVQRRPARLPC